MFSRLFKNDKTHEKSYYFLRHTNNTFKNESSCTHAKILKTSELYLGLYNYTLNLSTR